MSSILQPVMRRAHPLDAADIWAVRADSIREGCRNHYPAALIDALASEPLPQNFSDLMSSHYCVVALVQDRLVGFACLRPNASRVDAVFVRSGAMRRGVGAALLTHLESQARKLGLAALSLKASLNAVRFYERAGYVAGGEDCHITRSGHRIACVHMDKRLAAETDA